MVLVVSNKKSSSRELTGILNILGIVSYPTTAKEALSEISPMYRAVIVIEPGFLYDAKAFVETIRSYVKNMPVFALYVKEIGKEGRHFTSCFVDNVYSSTIVCKMIDYAKANDIPCIGDYRLAGINASADLHEILYFDKTLNLTKTESRILRFLMRSYPTPRKSETIIKYLYNPSKAPNPSSIRTHICKINSKFEALYGKGIISSPEGQGYVIYTPILRARAKEKEKEEKVQA